MNVPKKRTIDHQVIKAWIEKNHGQPAVIVDPSIESAQVGLRIDFPGHGDDSLLSHARRSRTISYQDFFKYFEEKNLAFEYVDSDKLVDLADAYDFIPRHGNTEVISPVNLDQAESAIRDGLPKYYEHDGRSGDPHESEVEPVIPEDIAGEESLGGDTPSLETDDDTTQAAADLGLLEPEDKSRLQNQG